MCHDYFMDRAFSGHGCQPRKGLADLKERRSGLPWCEAYLALKADEYANPTWLYLALSSKLLLTEFPGGFVDCLWWLPPIRVGGWREGPKGFCAPRFCCHRMARHTRRRQSIGFGQTSSLVVARMVAQKTTPLTYLGGRISSRLIESSGQLGKGERV